jgi:hypothetical protein
MIKKTGYIFFSFIVLLLWQQCCFGIAQTPEANRVFDPSFKTRYTLEKYNYEGRKIISRTREGSGQYEDYQNKKPKEKEEKDKEAYSVNLSFIDWIFYGALALAVLYLAYVLLNNGASGGIFKSNKNKPIDAYRDITAENIEHADIHALIKQAEDQNNFRLAIRYYYLLVLKTLSLKNHIKFEDDKTNAEYLAELESKPFEKDFSYISYLYNYIWYGKFNLDVTQYAKAKTNFTTLLKQVN